MVIRPLWSTLTLGRFLATPVPPQSSIPCLFVILLDFAMYLRDSCLISYNQKGVMRSRQPDFPLPSKRALQRAQCSGTTSESKSVHNEIPPPAGA